MESALTETSGSPQSSQFWRERVRSLPVLDQVALELYLTPRTTPYMRQEPTPQQAAYLLLNSREALYGGAAGGGKSSALLLAALQYVDVPDYNAILFRKTYADLARPGAIMDRAHEWLTPTDARWNGETHTWRFPSGATLSFGYLQGYADVYAYQGSDFAFIGFDELTQHEERCYRYLFSRLRKAADSKVPVRMRSTSNPGGIGHEWVFKRFFLEGRAKGRHFVPAKLEDNPHLDRDAYEASLEELDPVTRAQLRHGDWSVIDRSNALVPEFTPALKAQIVGVRERPKFYRAYAAADTGSQDLTVVLYALLHFEEAALYVMKEDVLRDPSTGQFGRVVTARERELWGQWEAGSKWSDLGALKPRRYADASLRLSVDLRDEELEQDANFTGPDSEGNAFELAKKRNAVAARNRARSLLAAGRIWIHPDCVVLIATLAGAQWNDKRTDYLRTEKTGHADAWDTLVYLCRMVNWTENPNPVVEPVGFFGEKAKERQQVSQNFQGQRRGKPPTRVKPL